MSELENKDNPDIKPISNKECLICLEELETNLIQLPCECSSNIYHRECIDKMLKSGTNKNFCPHCKQKYYISNFLITQHTDIENNTNIIINQNEIIDITNFITIFEFREFERKIKKYIFVSHIFVNMLTNISMVVIIATNNHFVLFHSNKYTSGLFIFGLFKTLFNNIILLYSGDYPNLTNKFLFCSYFIQIFIIMFFGFTFNKIGRVTSVLLIVNFSLTSFIDFCIRIFFQNDLVNYNLRIRNL